METCTVSGNLELSETSNIISLPLKLGLFPDVDCKIEAFGDSKLYRYFDKAEHRDSFSSGNIWFAGMTQNRYANTELGDPNEYLGSHHMPAFTICMYALSWTSNAPGTFAKDDCFYKKPYVSIENPRAYVETLKNVILEEAKVTVSLFKNLQLLTQKNRNCFPSITQNPELIAQVIEAKYLQCRVMSFVAKKMRYWDENDKKIDYLQSIFCGEKNKKFAHEKEYRIEFQTSSFLNEMEQNIQPNLDHFVQYIKFYIPEVKKYIFF